MKKNILIAISIVGLVLTLIPSMLVFAGRISLETHYTLMLVGTVLWLATAPFWMGRRKKVEERKKMVEGGGQP